MRTSRPFAVVLALLLLFSVALVATLIGAVSIPARGALATILDHLPFVDVSTDLDATQEAIVWDIRFPRVVLAAMVGGALSLAGASYQGVFRNPLADPYLLGAAAGAGVGATLAIAYLHSDSALAPLSFIGAIVGVALAWIIGSAADASRNPATVLLAGVAVMSFLTALQTFLQQRRTDSLQTVYAWILGHLTTGGWDDVGRMAPYLIVSSTVLIAHGRLLDVMTTGDDKAKSLGVPASRVRALVVIAASLATAAAVAVSGLIGFVGLVVPHIVRRLVGTSYRIVLPISLIGGAAFLILADLIARTIVAPAELPIGVITAFVGAPFFAFLLRATRRRVV